MPGTARGEHVHCMTVQRCAHANCKGLHVPMILRPLSCKHLDAQAIEMTEAADVESLSQSTRRIQPKRGVQPSSCHLPDLRCKCSVLKWVTPMGAAACRASAVLSASW